jgi:hypothetical protein
MFYTKSEHISVYTFSMYQLELAIFQVLSGHTGQMVTELYNSISRMLKERSESRAD